MRNPSLSDREGASYPMKRLADIVRRLFANVKRYGWAGWGNVASDVARRVSMGSFTGKRQIVRDRLTACSILLNRPTLSLRALRRPTIYTHRQRERERERERGRQSLPWKSIGDPNETHSYLVSTSPKLSSLFVKINLWLPLNHVSAGEIGKCREARFLCSSVSF